MATDFMKLKASLSLDSKEYEDGLNKSEKLAKGFGKFFKASAVAIGAVSTAVGVLAKKSVSAYGEYEQLAGGIKKLYGDGADDMLEYANQAYLTSGMSANAYMQNVTGFSAALLNSVEGDSKEAARIADMAMQDISDNANTFGKYTAEELAGVYQALAKGQYQTLDNLNLGFGGTKEGMQSLIDKANELAREQGMAGDLQIDSYSDIVQAIHLVQENLNITGTTQTEAAKTIQGSLNMTKAAWDNLIAGLANPKADMGKLMDNLVTAIVGDKQGEGLLNQIIPAIQNAVEGIGILLQSAIPMLAEQLPSLIQSFLPVTLEALATLVGSILKELPNILKTIVVMLPQLLDMIFGTLDKILDPAITSLVNKFFKLAKNIVEKIKQGLGDIANVGREYIQKFLEAVTNGLISVATNAFNFAKRIFGNIKTGLGSLWSVGANLIEGLWGGIKSKFDAVVAKVRSLASALPNAVKKVLGIASPSKVFIEIGKWIPEGLAEGIERNMKAVYSASDIMAGATAFSPKTNKISSTSNTSNTNSGNIIINLNYNASDDANDMLSDLVKGVRRYRMAGAI